MKCMLVRAILYNIFDICNIFTCNVIFTESNSQAWRRAKDCQYYDWKIVSTCLVMLVTRGILD